MKETLMAVCKVFHRLMH